jgi:hypothetical protein
MKRRLQEAECIPVASTGVVGVNLVIRCVKAVSVSVRSKKIRDADVAREWTRWRWKRKGLVAARGDPVPLCWEGAQVAFPVAPPRTTPTKPRRRKTLATLTLALHLSSPPLSQLTWQL